MASEPSAAQRKLYAKMHYAMPDGSFYIRPLPDGKDDLENAIKAVGRGEQGGTSGATIRKHIMMRAAAIKLSSEIPDTWNPDGTLKEAAQSSMTLTEFFAHHGVKGSAAHGINGVNALMPQPGNPTNESSETSDHDMVVQAAEDHEAVAAAHVSAAKKTQAQDAELMKSGLDSPAAKSAYGDKASKQGDGEFRAKNAVSKAQAITKLHNNLQASASQHMQAANQHNVLAQKLRDKASKMSHDGLNFDPNFDVDVYLSHFGVKGMHWGSRKPSGPASEDHAQAVQIKGKIKVNGGIHALSNDELKTLNERLNLESNYSRLNPEEVGAGQKTVGHLLGISGNVANQQANKYANKAASAAIDHLISEAGKKSASQQRNAPLRVVSIK